MMIANARSSDVELLTRYFGFGETVIGLAAVYGVSYQAIECRIYHACRRLVRANNRSLPRSSVGAEARALKNCLSSIGTAWQDYRIHGRKTFDYGGGINTNRQRIKVSIGTHHALPKSPPSGAAV